VYGKFTELRFVMLKCVSGIGLIVEVPGQYRPLSRCLCCHIPTSSLISLRLLFTFMLFVRRKCSEHRAIGKVLCDQQAMC
jgi:hypothetical protein